MQGIDPLKYYERRGKHSETLVVKSIGKAMTTGNDQQVIAGVSGKRLRIMGWAAQSNTSTVGWYQFEDGSAGSDLASVLYAPASNSAQTQQFPITDSGYFETSTGTGLYADIGTATVNLTIFYVEYTP